MYGNIAAAAEYDEEATCLVDYTTDSGLGVGCGGGEAAHEGDTKGSSKSKALLIVEHSIGCKCTESIGCYVFGKDRTITKGVVEYNSKNTDALTFSGRPARAMGALGLGKLLSTDGTPCKYSKKAPHYVKDELGVPKLTIGTEKTDKATETD